MCIKISISANPAVFFSNFSSDIPHIRSHHSSALKNIKNVNLEKLFYFLKIISYFPFSKYLKRRVKLQHNASSKFPRMGRAKWERGKAWFIAASTAAALFLLGRSSVSTSRCWCYRRRVREIETERGRWEYEKGRGKVIQELLHRRRRRISS